MNQSEKEVLAKWIAEKVLGAEIKGTREKSWVIKAFGLVCKYEIVDKIYSPKGFFAVWDAVDNKYNTIDIWQSTIKDLYFNGDSKDRYEAFYKSVKEVWDD